MRISDIPDFPPRAAKALRGVGVETIEKASELSAASLLALNGIGEKSLEDLTAAGWTPGDDDSLATSQSAGDSEAAAELAEEIFAPHPRLYGRFERAMRAERFFLELCKNAVPSPQLVAQAWELARAFEKEAERASGTEIVAYDGLRVAFQGSDWTLRTSFKPGEKKPDGMKTVALVPAES